MSSPLGALEFFSGIGAFHEAARRRKIDVVAAYDQDERANQTYRHNFSILPNSKNLDTIKPNQIPASDIWWLSPPCTPFSVRGKRRDLDDARTDSFKHLMALIGRSPPRAVIIENVLAFEGSRAHQLALSVLSGLEFDTHGTTLCPTDFGVPMRRPRFYLIATSGGARFDSRNPIALEPQPLERFLDETFDPELIVSPALLQRYGESLHIIDEGEPDAQAICFTRGYWKSMKASGSFIKLKNGAVRRFSPDEILKLLGFAPMFTFPPTLTLRARLQLAGNSVDVRAISHILSSLSM